MGRLDRLRIKCAVISFLVVCIYVIRKVLFSSFRGIGRLGKEEGGVDYFVGFMAFVFN